MQKTKSVAMKTTDQDLIYRGWFEHHPNRGGEPVLPQTAEVKAFMGNCWPMSAHYVNPIPMVFLVQIFDLSLLEKKSSWIVRDGLVPILWFFNRFPKPGKLTSKIFVDEDLSQYVPAAWHGHVGTYRIHSTSTTPTTRFALVGMVCDMFCSINHVKNTLPKMMEKIGPNGAVDLFMPARARWEFEPEQTFHPSFYRELFSKLGDNVRIFTRGELVNTFDMQNISVFEMNEKTLLSDNAIVHDLLRKGAQWANSREIQANEEFVRLSPNHGFVMSKKIRGAGTEPSPSFNQAEEYHELVSDALQSRAFHSLPWPTWFASWARAVSDQAAPVASAISVTKAAKSTKPKKKR